MIAVLLVAASLIFGVSLAWAQTTGPEQRQQMDLQSSPSPIPLQFPTGTNTPGPPTETPTRTPTSGGRAVVEALSDDPPSNVRAGPDINETKLGEIHPGFQYVVVGKRFDWYQIEFPDSPTGRAWVYKHVVTLTGDEALIPEIALEEIPTLDPTFIAIQETALFLTATPGAIASLTVEVQLTPTGVFTPDPNSSGPTLAPGAPLPTYTSPPITNTPIIIPKASPANTGNTGEGLPPIVPILALGALGLMGLLVSVLRRL